MIKNDTFLKACRREPTDYTPIWLMRQAGRYMKEYRMIRQKLPFITMCKTPDLAAEVTLQPVERFGVDAAILFSDILVPLEPMGIELEYTKGGGPVLHNPVRTVEAIDRIRIIEPQEDVPYVLQAIRTVKQALLDRIPLIGFAGAPFTLASYMIEGGQSHNFVHTKQCMFQEPEAWHRLMETLAENTVRYLTAQIEAGADAVQLFDSWVGCLSPDDYRAYVLPYSRRVFQGLPGSVPAIHFGTISSTLLPHMRDAGGDVIGADWRIDLAQAWKAIGYDRAIQGNLDPVSLFAPLPVIRNLAGKILALAENRPGHIFNLGHGILPETPVDHVAALIETVHELSRR